MSIRSKVCELVRRQLAEARRNRAFTIWSYAAGACGVLVGGFLLDGGYTGALIGGLLAAFIVAIVFTGMEDLEKREKNRKVLEVVAALIFDDSGRVLATQCAPHKHGGGWEFPGGKIEPGESQQEAVVREIREELALEVAVGPLLHTVNWHYPSFHLRMHCYACTLLGGELTLREHADARWLAADALDTVPWLPADVDVLPALAAYMRRG